MCRQRPLTRRRRLPREPVSRGNPRHRAGDSAGTQEILMSAAGEVTLDQVRHVADLANLELTAEELPRLAHDLNAILGHIAQLRELDTTQIEPMAQVAEVL